jgi:hypothetical protein
MKHLRYLRYVLRHKWFVFVACCAAGIWWRGIVHDWTKFLPCEWFPYMEYFEGKESRDNGGPSIAGQYRFDKAWLHHQHANKHHWQHWVLRNDNGKTTALFMPEVYRREMVADWRGAGRALGFPDTRAWYLKNRANIILNASTRDLVERELGVL